MKLGELGNYDQNYVDQQAPKIKRLKSYQPH